MASHTTRRRRARRRPAPPPQRRAHSINEACSKTGLGRDSIYRAIREGRLVARKFGSRTIITDDAIDQFLAGLPLLTDAR